MIALVVLCGALVAAGVVGVVFGLTHAHVPRPTAPVPAARRFWDGRRPQALRLALAIAAGVVAAVLTGWPLLALLVPVVAFALPTLLSAPPDREVELLQAVDRWVRTLGSLLPTGRSVADAVRVSVRQAPALIAPNLRVLVARLDERWTIEQGLRAMADELDSPDTDAVLAALALAARRGGTGASQTLTALADNLQDRLRALREISSERAKPRFVVRQVTLITSVALVAALVFGGDFFAPFGTPLGQVLLAGLVLAYLASLLFLRRMTLPRPRQRILSTRTLTPSAAAEAP